LDSTIGLRWLVDTGADTSLLNPRDGVRSGLDYRRLVGESRSIGVGGEVRLFVEPAVFVFTEDGKKIYAYFLDLEISPPDPGIEGLPSLLGRDVLDCRAMTYDPTNQRLEFEVRSADLETDI
jgi:hypothetical protein